jgi:hypothetical protein
MPDRLKGKGQTNLVQIPLCLVLGEELTTALRRNVLLQNHGGGQNPHGVVTPVYKETHVYKHDATQCGYNAISANVNAVMRPVPKCKLLRNSD